MNTNSNIQINNNEVNNEISKLKNQIQNLNIEINKLRNENNTLKTDLNIKNQNINNYIAQLNDLKDSLKIKNNEVINLNNQINNLNDQIKKLNININNPNVKVDIHDIVTILFKSIDQKVEAAFSSPKSDLFVRLEEKLYDEYPEFRDLDNIYFTVNGKKIRRFRSLQENNLKNNDKILLNICEFN